MDGAYIPFILPKRRGIIGDERECNKAYRRNFSPRLWQPACGGASGNCCVFAIFGQKIGAFQLIYDFRRFKLSCGYKL